MYRKVSLEEELYAKLYNFTQKISNDDDKIQLPCQGTRNKLIEII